MRILLILTFVFIMQICSCQSNFTKPDNTSKLDIQEIKCSEIGIDRLREIISKYKIPSPEIEEEWILSKNQKSIFLHNLIYPYGVARKYYFHWMPKEETIDKSIEGYTKGVRKYLEEERDFRIGEYVVWWSMRSCIEHISQKIWEVSISLEEKNLSKIELEGLIDASKKGESESINRLKNHYQFLFDIVELKYSDLKIENTEIEYLEVIKKAINRNFSMEEFKNEDYEIYKNEFEFEDILILEYCLVFEEKIKIRTSK